MAGRKLIVSDGRFEQPAAAAGRHTDLPQEDSRAERESDRSRWSPYHQNRTLADLFRQLDDDPLRTADVAEPIAVLIALQLAHEFRGAGSQAGEDGVDVFDGECDMAEAWGVRRRVPVAALARGRVELRQLESSMAVRGLHDRDLCPDAVEPQDAIHPPALDRPLALQLESELDKELSRGREVINDDAHVVHPLDRHVVLHGGSPLLSAVTLVHA